MPISKSILNFLDKSNIKYEALEHRTVFTAFDKAATLGVKPETVAKTVVVSLDKKDHALAIIPANKNLDKKKLLKLINSSMKINSSHPPLKIRGGVEYFSHLDFAEEKWMKKNLKGVKVGATPPFGQIFKIPAFIDNILAKQSKIIVSSGNYENSLKISPAALFRADKNLVKGNFSQKKK